MPSPVTVSLSLTEEEEEEEEEEEGVVEEEVEEEISKSDAAHLSALVCAVCLL
jgi:hypothetical protein